jgi:hypothetical protein
LPALDIFRVDTHLFHLGDCVVVFLVHRFLSSCCIEFSV